MKATAREAQYPIRVSGTPRASPVLVLVVLDRSYSPAYHRLDGLNIPPYLLQLVLWQSNGHGRRNLSVDNAAGVLRLLQCETGDDTVVGNAFIGQPQQVPLDVLNGRAGRLYHDGQHVGWPENEKQPLLLARLASGAAVAGRPPLIQRAGETVSSRVAH